MATQTSTLPPPSLFQNRPIASNAVAPAPAASAAPAPSSPRTYKDFLTPALHRRFTKATGLILLFCWLGAGLLSDRGWFTAWIPFPWTIITCLLLYIPCLSVFIVRVANLHVGEKSTTSQAETLYQFATSFNTYHTLLWYGFSGWFFGEVFIWSSSQTSSLSMIDRGGWNMKARLNENPVILRTLLVMLGLEQAIKHLAMSYDSVSVQRTQEKTTHQGPSTGISQRVPWMPKALVEVAEHWKTMGMRVVPMAGLTVIFGPLIYLALLRRIAWSIMSTFGRVFFRDLPYGAPPPGAQQLPTLYWQALSSSVMLLVLYEFSNAIFTACVSELPLKKGQPLTSQLVSATGIITSKSVDPNATLINGLKSKKELTQSFAFWELATIVSSFPDRRRSLYREFDRSGGSTWSQLSSLCLSELSAIRSRIQTVIDPANNAVNAQQIAQEREQQKGLIVSQKAQELGLPRIADKGLVSDQNVQQQPSGATSGISRAARNFGQQPQAQTPTKHVRNYVEKHSQGYYQEVTTTANTYLHRFLQLPIVGEIFRQTFARMVKAVVFGVPHSSQANILHAVQALTKLVVCSIAEDDYGQVATSVGTIIRTFTATIKEIEVFVGTFRPSWTDVDFVERKRDEVQEVKAVLQVLKGGLEEVLLAFGEYAGSIGVSAAEIRAANEAVGKGREMESRRTR